MKKITTQALVFCILGFLAVASVLAGEKKLIQQIREKMQKKINKIKQLNVHCVLVSDW